MSDVFRPPLATMDSSVSVGLGTVGMTLGLTP
jgi:hypothetical protein